MNKRLTFGIWGTLRGMAAVRIIDFALWIAPKGAAEAKLKIVAAQLSLVYAVAGDTDSNATAFVDTAKARIIAAGENAIRAEAEKMKAELQ